MTDFDYGVLKYKGFTGTVELDVHAVQWFGRVLEVGPELLTYEVNDFNELQTIFETAVDKYIRECEKND